MDFSALQFDPSRPGKLIENYPELLEYKQFTNVADDLFLKLAILISDEESPFVKKERNFRGIVVTASDYLGIPETIQDDLINGNLTETVAKIIDMQSVYFMMFNNWEYQSWWDMCFQYHRNSLLLRTPIDFSDKDYEKKSETTQRIRIHQKSLQADLIQYENLIFPKGTNVKKVVSKDTAKKLTNWAEKMAKEKPSYI